MTIAERIEAIAAALGVAVPHDAIGLTSHPFWSDVLGYFQALGVI